MSELIALAGHVKELGTTALVVGASIWLLVKFIPSQMRQQGEISEIIKNNSAVIANCTEVLKMVSVKDSEVNAALERIEEAVHSTSRDVRYLKISSERKEK